MLVASTAPLAVALALAWPLAVGAPPASALHQDVPAGVEPKDLKDPKDVNNIKDPKELPPKEGPRAEVVKPIVARFGTFDLDGTAATLAQLPELRACAEVFGRPAGTADCALGPNDESLARLQAAWEATKPGGELVALRLVFDPLKAPPLTELEWQLTRAWGPPALEQLRRDKDLKIFTLQWEDGEHRATLEASAPASQPSRAVVVTLERKPHALTGDLAGLKPRPFPGLRLRLAKRLDWEQSTWALVWGTSLSPVQELLREASPAWAQQRNYVGLWHLEERGRGPKRWRPAWERTIGEEEDDPQRVRRLEVRDITGDSTADVILELTCQSCGQTASELLVKTLRAGKLVDLLGKQLLHASTDLGTVGMVRIQESEGDGAVKVSSYAYERGKGAFVLAREERKRLE